MCQKCKIQRAPHRKTENLGKDHIAVHDDPQEFGDIITADHKVILNKAFTSFDKDCVCLVIQDRATYFFGMYLADSKDSVRTAQGFNLFIEPQDKVKLIHSDNSGEIDVACKKLSPKHDGSLAERPQSNGAAEQSVRRGVAGTRCLLAQSGLSLRYWRQAVLCFSCSRNFFDVINAGPYKGQTPYKAKFKHDFNGKKVRFGEKIEFLPSQKDLIQDTHPFAPKVREGLFIGYVLASGGRWAGQYMIIDKKKFESRPANRKVTCNVVKEIIVPNEPSFPVALGLWKPKPAEESDKELEENNEEGKQETEELTQDEATIDEESEYKKTLEIIPPEETPISEKNRRNSEY